MSEITKSFETNETKVSEVEDYKEIKEDGDMSVEEADKFWDEQFGTEDTSEGAEDNSEITENTAETSEDDNVEDDIEKTLNEYFDDLKSKSECPDTIPDKPFDKSDLNKISPEENALMRDEVDDKKAQLKREWEEANGRPWPKYDHDVYSSNGKLIRKAGSDYDAHHIQPLGMGGKNEAKNITPLNAEVHYDKQGVHAPDSPYSKLDKMLGGME